MTVPTIQSPFMSPEVVGIFEDTFAAAVKTIMAGNFFISLLLASVIQYLWGMINSLQIIVLGVLLNFM